MTTTTEAGATSAPAAGPVQITEPGVHQMTAEEYHADPVPGGSLSSSGARRLLPPSCPALFRYEQQNPREPKAHFDIGHATHRIVLDDGPELVELDFADWRTKAARAEREAVRAEGAVPLLPDDYRMVHGMAAALRAHPFAGVLFDPARGGTAEQSLFWRDRPTGVMRRARLDWLPAAGKNRMIIPDYKTCRSAEPEAIRRAVAEHGYHQQDDWYRTGARDLGLASEDAAFVFVFQEKTPPYVVTVVELDVMCRRIGAARNRRAIETYAECRRTGHWRGYRDDIAHLSLPPYAENRDIEEYL